MRLGNLARDRQRQCRHTNVLRQVQKHLIGSAGWWDGAARGIDRDDIAGAARLAKKTTVFEPFRCDVGTVCNVLYQVVVVLEGVRKGVGSRVLQPPQSLTIRLAKILVRSRGNRVLGPLFCARFDGIIHAENILAASDGNRQLRKFARVLFLVYYRAFLHPRKTTMPTQRNARPARDVADDGVLELNWDVFGELCRALALKVAQSGYAPEIVVGIAKAGVIPGAVVASMLACDFFSMKISRDTDTGQIRSRPKIIQAAPREALNKRVLIVDEITTSGDTLRMATNALRQVGPAEIRTATNFVKLGAFKPDFYALETASTVVFPWDRELISAEGDLVNNPFYSQVLR